MWLASVRCPIDQILLPYSICLSQSPFFCLSVYACSFSSLLFASVVDVVVEKTLLDGEPIAARKLQLIFNNPRPLEKLRPYAIAALRFAALQWPESPPPPPPQRLREIAARDLRQSNPSLGFRSEEAEVRGERNVDTLIDNKSPIGMVAAITRQSYGKWERESESEK